jgi:hypothetical protein
VSKFLLNLHVQISKALINSKIQFLFRKDFLASGPTASRPIQPFWPTQTHRPSSSSFTASARLFCRLPFPLSAPLAHTRLWHILQNTLSSLIRTFNPRLLLSLPSLTHGPHVSALSPNPRQSTAAAPPPNPSASGLPALPSSSPRVAAFVP